MQEGTFESWMSTPELRFGLVLQRWWARLESGEEGEVTNIRQEDDESAVDLFISLMFMNRLLIS